MMSISCFEFSHKFPYSLHRNHTESPALLPKRGFIHSGFICAKPSVGVAFVGHIIAA
jgi:hypothetical protein